MIAGLITVCSPFLQDAHRRIILEMEDSQPFLIVSCWNDEWSFIMSSTNSVAAVDRHDVLLSAIAISWGEGNVVVSA